MGKFESTCTMDLEEVLFPSSDKSRIYKVHTQSIHSSDSTRKENFLFLTSVFENDILATTTLSKTKDEALSRHVEAVEVIRTGR